LSPKNLGLSRPTSIDAPHSLAKRRLLISSDSQAHLRPADWVSSVMIFLALTDTSRFSAAGAVSGGFPDV